MTVKVTEEKYVAFSNFKFKFIIDELNIKNETSEKHLITLYNFEDIT